MSETARLSTKGQLVLPKSLRSRHGWEAGTELVVEDRGTHLVLRAVPSRVAAGGALTWSDLRGAAGYRGPRRSLADMERAVAEQARSSR